MKPKVQIIDDIQLYRNVRLKRSIVLTLDYMNELWGRGKLVLTDEMLEELDVQENDQLLIFLRSDGRAVIGVIEKN